MVAATLVLAALALCGAAFRMPVSFDMAYNLQVVRHLLAGDGYATDGALLGGREPVQYDPFITTGPTVLLPVAALAAVLGQYVWAFRIVPVLAFLALFAAWGVAGRRAAGRWGAAAGLAGVLMVNTLAGTWASSVLYGPGDVLGEAMAAALFMIGVLSLQRPWSAGVALGAAVMAKVIAVLFLPAVVLFLLRRGRWHLSWASLGFAVPVAGWQLVRLFTLGPRGAIEADRRFLLVLRIEGSGLAPGHRVGPVQKLLDELALLGWSGSLAVVLCLVLLIVGLGRRRSSRRSPTSLVASRSVAPLTSERVSDGDLAVRLAVGAGLCAELWWLLLSDRDWVRHVVPAAFLLVPAAMVLATTELRRVTRGRAVLASALFLMTAVAVAANVASAWTPPGPRLADQRAVAREVAAQGDRFAVASPWSFAPELTLLGGARAEPLRPSSTLLVVPLRWAGVENSTAETEMKHCGRVLFERADFLVCRPRPSPRHAPTG